MNLGINSKLSLINLPMFLSFFILFSITSCFSEYKKVNHEVMQYFDDFQKVASFILREYSDEDLTPPYQYNSIGVDITNTKKIDDFFGAKPNKEDLYVSLNRLKSTIELKAISIQNKEKIVFPLKTYNFSFAEEKYAHSLIYFYQDKPPEYNFLDASLKVEKIERMTANWYYVIIHEKGW